MLKMVGICIIVGNPVEKDCSRDLRVEKGQGLEICLFFKVSRQAVGSSQSPV
jgi:hypothetical protein